MTINRTASLIMTVAALICAPALAFAQTAPTAPPHVPLQKTIGGVAKPEVVPSLIVFNSRGASLQGGKLVLNGIAKRDRLCRSARPRRRP
jgi:hypothetical protein